MGASVEMMPGALPRPVQIIADELEARLPPQWRNRVKDAFFLTGSLIPLAASATTPITMQIQSDSDFVILGAAAVVTNTANTTRLTFIPQLVTMLTATSGRQFQTEATHFHNVYGTAEEPCWWKQPKLLAAGGQFVVTHTDQSAIASNVRVCFYGFKLFRNMREAAASL